MTGAQGIALGLLAIVLGLLGGALAAGAGYGTDRLLAAWGAPEHTWGGCAVALLVLMGFWLAVVVIWT